MNDNELRAIIEVAQTIAIVIVTISGIVTTIFTYMTRKDMSKVGQDVADVVKHTNSMKDELVAAVKEAATATGKEAGRKEVQEEQNEKR